MRCNRTELRTTSRVCRHYSDKHNPRTPRPPVSFVNISRQHNHKTHQRAAQPFQDAAEAWLSQARPAATGSQPGFVADEAFNARYASTAGLKPVGQGARCRVHLRLRLDTTWHCLVIQTLPSLDAAQAPVVSVRKPSRLIPGPTCDRPVDPTRTKHRAITSKERGSNDPTPETLGVRTQGAESRS